MVFAIPSRLIHGLSGDRPRDKRANEQFNYAMYDLQGVVVEEGQGENVYYAGSTLPSGLYIVKVRSESGSKVFKVTKK